jgi:hypothetical protein
VRYPCRSRLRSLSLLRCDQSFWVALVLEVVEAAVGQLMATLDSPGGMMTYVSRWHRVRGPRRFRSMSYALRVGQKVQSGFSATVFERQRPSTHHQIQSQDRARRC